MSTEAVRALSRQWIMRYPDGTIASGQMAYWHGRHRPHGGNGPLFRAGAWCKWVGTHWEPITSTNATEGAL